MPRPLLLALAVLLAAGNLLYAGLWIYYIRHSPRVQLGIHTDYAPQEAAIVVTGVVPGSPAEHAGLRGGDRIVAVNAQLLTGPYLEAVMRGAPGDVVRLTIQRPGTEHLDTLAATLQPAPPGASPPPARRLANELISVYAVPFILVGLGVLFSRLHDRNAWLLALLFASFAAGGPFLVIEGQIPPRLRGFAVFWKVLFSALAPGLFYYFFAVFPSRSALDREVPWLKRLLLWGVAVVMVPVAVWGWWAGGSAPLLRLAAAAGPTGTLMGVVLSLAAFGLGFASLLANTRAGTPDVRRKTRVIMWGVLAGFTPVLVVNTFADMAGRGMDDLPFWVWAPAVLALFLVPASFAYAVIVHRALDIPVLLKRSARYLLVKRGFAALTLTAALGSTALLALSFSSFLSPRTPLAVPTGLVVGAGFGALLVSAGMRFERRVASRIDRAFFRGAYDARQILEDLAEQVRGATDAPALAVLLDRQLREALHPRALTIYLEGADGSLHIERGVAPPASQALSPSLPLLHELARRGEPWEVPPGAPLDGLEALDPECLTPILGRMGRLAGLLALGERLSEESYSREDRRLLSSVAGQAGVALENIRLAEHMAERLEAERRASYEMDIAQQVQRRLFPQVMPALRTLEYAGGCRQARAVGGDYFDFLDLGPGRLGLVLADIAGKGIPAALLMATLQATLRSQQAGLGDAARVLCAVNRVFYPSAAPNRFATLFFGEYHDATRRLRYANCGHNPPALLRADGRVERLPATATVLGLFEEFECAVAEVGVEPGDLLLVFSDGASEAWSDAGEEYGEERLIQATLARRHQPVQEMLDAIMREVRLFSGRDQDDDLTLLLARAR